MNLLEEFFTCVFLTQMNKVILNLDYQDGEYVNSFVSSNQDIIKEGSLNHV